MPAYIYDGEYNVPMNAVAIETHDPEIKDGRMMIMDRIELDDPFDGPHNPTGYLSRAEMKAWESGEALPFTDPPAEWELEAEEEGYE